MIARGYRLGVAQRAVQLDVQLDELAALASAEDLEVLGLPARDADDGEAVGRHRAEGGRRVNVLAIVGRPAVSDRDGRPSDWAMRLTFSSEGFISPQRSTWSPTRSLTFSAPRVPSSASTRPVAVATTNRWAKTSVTLLETFV